MAASTPHVQTGQASDLDTAATLLQRFAPRGFEESLAQRDLIWPGTAAVLSAKLPDEATRVHLIFNAYFVHKDCGPLIASTQVCVSRPS